MFPPGLNSNLPPSGWWRCLTGGVGLTPVSRAPALSCPPVELFPSHMFGQRPAQTTTSLSLSASTTNKYFLQIEYSWL